MCAAAWLVLKLHHPQINLRWPHRDYWDAPPATRRGRTAQARGVAGSRSAGPWLTLPRPRARTPSQTGLRTGSTERPSWRNATRLPTLKALASSSGFSMPATCFCIAASDSRIDRRAAHAWRAGRALALVGWRSKKENSSETGTKPARCQPVSCLAVMCRIRSMSARQNRFMEARSGSGLYD